MGFINRFVFWEKFSREKTELLLGLWQKHLMKESTVENKNGILIEVSFKNGSSLCFLDEDDTFKSFYVKEKDFENLRIEFNTIIDKLK